MKTTETTGDYTGRFQSAAVGLMRSQRASSPRGAGVTVLCAHLAELSHDLPEEAVQDGQLPAQVDVALKSTRVADAVQVGDLVEELLHGAPLHFQKLIHEAHVLLFTPKPAGGGRPERQV